MLPMEADMASQEDEGMASSSSEDGETSDPIDLTLVEGDNNTSTDASTDTWGTRIPLGCPLRPNSRAMGPWRAGLG